MFSERTMSLVRAAGAAAGMAENERAALRRRLSPLLRAAVHGLTVAADALDGPDPEIGAMYLHDSLVSLSRALDRAAPRLTS